MTDPVSGNPMHDGRSRMTLWEIFQIRDFRLIWGSASLSFVCMWMEVVTLGLLILKLTDSPWQVALVAALRMSANVLFGMLSGTIADRVNRWRIMVVSRIIAVLATATLFTLVVTDLVQPWNVFLVAVVLGFPFVLDLPSRLPFITDLLGRQNVVRAMSLETFNLTVGKMVGPVMAGILIQFTGFEGAYAFILAAYVLALLLISRVQSRGPRPSAAPPPLWRSLRSGVGYVLHSRAILGVLGTTMIMNAFAFSALQLFPVVARDHLHVGPALTGLLIAGDGIGLLIGVTIIVYLGTIRYIGRVYLIGSALQLLSLLVFALSPSYLLSFFLVVLSGVGSATFFTLQGSIILITTEPERRGTVMGIAVQCMGAGTLGVLELGAVATLLNSQWGIGINSGIGLLLMLPIIFLTPLMWRQIATPAEGTPRPGETPTTSDAPRSQGGDRD